MNKYFSAFIAAFIFTVIFFTMINFSSCDETPVDPYGKLKPGRRDYVWEVDTLKMPFYHSLHRIWGSSESDVWAIGPGGDLDKTIYHYNGEKWTNDGISRGISPISIWGFGPNDVWLGGLEGRIWHYDGIKWQENFYIDDPLFVYSGFMDIYGDEPNNVYAVGFFDSTDGRKGMIFHYDGTKWERVNIGYTNSTLARIKRGVKTSANYFIRGIVEDNWKEDTTKIYMFDGKKLTQLYSAIDSKNKTNFIQNINDEIVIVIGYTLNRYRNNKFERFYDISESNFGIPIFGRTLKDIFLTMEDGLAHYNGENVQYLIKLNKIIISECSIFKNNVFFLANDFNKGLNLVYKGTLKE